MTRSFACSIVALALVGCGGDDDEPPRLCTDQFPVAFQEWPAGRGPLPWPVILQNVGNGTLEISSIEVRGDVNCSLVDPPQLDVDLPAELTSEDQAILRINYQAGGDPSAPVGTYDNFAIVITSNSATEKEGDSPQCGSLPVYQLSVCGCVVDPDEEDPPPCECNLTTVPEENCPG